MHFLQLQSEHYFVTKKKFTQLNISLKKFLYTIKMAFKVFGLTKEWNTQKRCQNIIHMAVLTLFR